MKLPKFLYKLVSIHKTSLGNNEAFPPEEDYSFDYSILKKRYNNVCEALSNEFGADSLDNTFLTKRLSSLMTECKKREKNIKNNLVTLCENIINKTLEVPSETVILNCEIVDKISPNNSFRIMPEESDKRTFSFEDLNDFNNANKVILKRRLINSLIQGASYRCGLLYNNYIDEIEKLDNGLPQIYKEILLINDYLLFSKEEKINDDNIMQGSCVEVMLGRNDEKTEINSQGLIFPFLLSETFRGFFELFASHGLPKDYEKANYIIKQSDFLLAEPWDLRLGVGLWDIISKDIDKPNVLPYYFSNLCKMGVEDFNNSLKEIFANTKLGQNIKNDLYDESLHEFEMRQFIGTIDKKNSEESLLNDSYISSDELDDYLLTDDNENGVIEEENDEDNNINYIDIARTCTEDDIDFSEEELPIPQFQIHTYIKNIKFPEKLINFRLEPRHIYTNNGEEDLYQIHIFLDKSIQHLGLGYKIYCKAISIYGNLYSGYGRRLNKSEVPNIWNKLKNRFNVSIVKNINNVDLGIKATL